MKPKIMTFYLPQFHAIPENDEWWGEGFTDWISAKNAKPLFPGHYQPRLPEHDYYYNLLDKETMRWQAELAKKAGVYGFCIYHYWFGDDKQLLEKPAENLLKWQDIDINYCFSWANESWICSWSKIGGNPWIETVGKEEDGNGVLVKQKYGGKKEWRKHFEYLLPFFQDRRYIKKDNKPVFVIFRPKNIKRLNAMIVYWNLLAVEYGFSGIYFIGTNAGDWKEIGMDAGVIYEPDFSFKEKGKNVIRAGKQRELLASVNITIPYMYSFDKIWHRILTRPSMEGVYYGGLVGFDDSPRKGKKGRIMLGTSPSKFGRYFRSLYKKALSRGDEYIFLTAWNEWGEGAYLEPDNKYGMRYLQEISNIINSKYDCSLQKKKTEKKKGITTGLTLSRGSFVGAKAVESKQSEKKIEPNEQLQKLGEFYRLLLKWLEIEQRGYSLRTYFVENEYKTVAIYGMKELGERLYGELKDSAIEVKYIIDKNADALSLDVDVDIITPEESLEAVDVIVVTAVHYMDEIEEMLKQKVDYDILSLKEIINEMYEENILP